MNSLLERNLRRDLPSVPARANSAATHFAVSARNALQAFYLARSGMNVAEALLVLDAQQDAQQEEERSFYPYFFSQEDETGITGRLINGAT